MGENVINIINHSNIYVHVLSKKIMVRYINPINDMIQATRRCPASPCELTQHTRTSLSLQGFTLKLEANTKYRTYIAFSADNIKTQGSLNLIVLE